MFVSGPPPVHNFSGIKPVAGTQPVKNPPRFSGENAAPVPTGTRWFHNALNRRQVGEEALSEIYAALQSGRKLTAEDDNGWLGRLQKTFGTETIRMRHPDQLGEWLSFDGRLSAAAINENAKQNLEALFRTLMAMRYATYYMPNRRYFGYPLEIHNRDIAAMMKGAYKPAEFKTLFETCLEKGTFDFNTDAKTGLVKTAGIEESEDKIMSQGWITDSIRNGDRQRVSDPDGWKRVLHSIARFYQSEQPAFEAVIENPDSYRKDIRGAGVGHLFDPETFIRYDWLNPKRLESHGLAMRALCDELKQGTFGKEPPKEVLEAVSSLAKYFAVLDYPSAPSNGPWEEIVYNGFTWDTEAVRAGFESLRDLMHNPDYNADPVVQSVREQLRQTKYGDLLADKKELTQLIRKGQRKVADRVKNSPAEHPLRPPDASLAFVTTSTIRFSRDPIADIERHMKILDFVEEHVVKENGVIRYEPFETRLSSGKRVMTKDGYLMPNWGLAADSEGQVSLYKQRFAETMGYDISHIEPSSTDKFYARSTYGRDGKEAHWFMIAEIAKGYGRQLEKLLNHLDDRQLDDPDWAPNDRERALLEKLVAKETEFINRSFARITGEGMLKANGRPCEAWRVPEAYQHVSTFNGKLHGETETKMLPGVNTPLAWASSSLYAAAVLFENNLERLAKIS